MKVTAAEEKVECLEEPQLNDEGVTAAGDPDWYCELEKKGGDIDADDQEDDSPSINNIK